MIPTDRIFPSDNETAAALNEVQAFLAEMNKRFPVNAADNSAQGAFDMGYHQAIFEMGGHLFALHVKNLPVQRAKTASDPVGDEQ